ncbi:T9SS type A sorting domain-containing protein [Flavobacterium sp. ZS1P14]|uniref:T9SS type A sorting domain-containing protein n=1 Tax=Flavobacterium sp. ZS1P14 TaxID=3401729 RepID=UPI003AABC0FE
MILIIKIINNYRYNQIIYIYDDTKTISNCTSKKVHRYNESKPFNHRRTNYLCHTGSTFNATVGMGSYAWTGPEGFTAGTFVASSSFYDYFNIAKTPAISNKADLTMLGATQLGGGDCKALARHAVSALLGVAAFPTEYPYPAGSTDFASLYTLIRNAFLSGNCSSLANTLANINNLDGPFCSALSQLAQVAAQENATLTSKTANVGFEAYPVPFKDQLTIRYKFDYVSDVKIDVFNAQGISILSKADTNSFLNKKITLNLNAKKGQEQVYVVKLTTNRGSSTKKVISSK